MQEGATVSFPWYAVVSGADLEQGDLLDNCPVLLPPADIAFPLQTGSPPVDILTFDVVVLTQSCDLVNDKVEDVVLCPVATLTEVEQSSDFFRSSRGKEAIRRGDVPGYHMLAS
ncbi:MAG: hypothetical protein NZT92_06975 [Abditibacteriales bacterium]|nr:hypothetical protein [Abditibacteriales bacterium]MDW8364743.1 hypothetical protein [Abditibacteriales bacterium]